VRRAVIIAVVVAAALACARAALSARPRVLFNVGGRVQSPLASSGQWVTWLEGEEQERRLMVVGRSGGRAKVLLKSAGLSGLAADSGAAYVTRAASDQARGGPTPSEVEGRTPNELLAVSLSGGAARKLADLSEAADQIVSSQGWLAWRKSREPALPGVPFVAAAAPVTVIRAVAREGGTPHVIAVLGGGQTVRRGGLELLGIARDSVYWYERNTTPEGERTAIRRAPCSGGGIETVAVADGSRAAALDGDVLIWTAPSLEAGNPGTFSSVRRMELGRPGVKVIGDWLDSGTILLLSNGRAYAQDRGSLWRLSAKREEQARLYEGPPRLVSPRAIGDEEFMFMQLDRGVALAKRPLTLWARVRSAVWR